MICILHWECLVLLLVFNSLIFPSPNLGTTVSCSFFHAWELISNWFWFPFLWIAVNCWTSFGTFVCSGFFFSASMYCLFMKSYKADLKILYCLLHHDLCKNKSCLPLEQNKPTVNPLYLYFFLLTLIDLLPKHSPGSINIMFSLITPSLITNELIIPLVIFPDHIIMVTPAFSVSLIPFSKYFTPTCG